jgi:hypothetical protein
MARILKVVVVAVVTWMLVLFAYGVLRYHDGPIHQCASHGYCGKQGQPHTESEYRQYLEWQTTIEWSWPPGLLVLFLANKRRIPVPGRWRAN